MNDKLLLALVVGLSGCASYQAKPLSDHPEVLSAYSEITVERSRISLPELAAHEFNARDGLDIDEVAMLAVINNPDLKLARDDAQISRAQAFASGLLPDPQLSLSRDFPRSTLPGTTSTFSLGLSEDLNALIRHHFDSKAGGYDTHKTDLNLLWQEWQVVAKGRTLFVKLVEEKQQMRMLQQNQSLFADRYQRMQTALDRGLLTSDTVTPHLSALQDIGKQIRDLERQLNTDQHDLNAFLGLAPQAEVPLKESITMPAIDESAIVASLSDLSRRRPDLLALQYGYQAEDQRYRAAIVGQFPSVTVGVTRARDSSGVYSQGFGITLSLPIFNRNRGNIAIEEATRQKLYDDYQSRLNSAHSDVHRILAEQRINARQHQDVEKAIDELSRAALKADQAFQAHQIDAPTYVGLQASLLSKQIEKINLEQSMLLQRVALQTLLGGELPVKPD